MAEALTRRSLVAAIPASTGLSVASIGSALGATPVLARPIADYPDVELLSLGVQLAAALALKDELSKAADGAYEGFEPPPIPKVLFWRPSDHPAVWNAAPWVFLDGVEGPDGEDCYTYAREDMPAEMVRRLRDVCSTRTTSQKDIDRLEEIIAALNIWMADEAEALAHCGFTAAQHAYDRQSAVVTDLIKRIGSIRARTAEGVCVKARAAFAASHKSIKLVEAHRFTDLSRQSKFAPGELEELLTLSMMVDVHKLDTPEGEAERSAA